MSDTNTVVIISNKHELIKQVSQKLVLLRNLDKIKSYSLEEIQDIQDDFVFNVIILHCENNDVNALNLIKKFKKSPLHNQTPILLLNENCSRETIIEAFDNGISDVLFMPIIDYELLIRVIWCLKKNELNLNIESRINFLSTLGITQEDTGAYCSKYCEDFLRNEIAQSKKYSQRACILLISQDKKYPDYKSKKEFIQTIKKSIRLNDSIAIKDTDKYYVYLQKIKLNGAYSVFERINNNLGVDCGANAGVVELQNQKFEDITEALSDALEKANENSNSLIVASDFYSDKDHAVMNFDVPDKILEKQKIQQEQMEKLEKGELPKNIKKTNTAFDRTSAVLFNKAYKRKLKFVVIPAFKKYENILKIKQENMEIKSYIGESSLLSVKAGDVCANFALEYNGEEKVTLCLSVLNNEKKELYETETVDFTVLDFRKLSLMLSELINVFLDIVKKNC